MEHHLPLEVLRTSEYCTSYVLPKVFVFNCKKYQMTSPANLFTALNAAGVSFDDYFATQFGENLCKATGKRAPVKIERKKLCVFHYASRHLFREVKRKESQERKRRAKCKCCGSSYLKGTTGRRGSCGKEECTTQISALIGKSISDNHWHKSEKGAEIEKRRLETRLREDKLRSRKYRAWNKGKKGIYSTATLQKISDAARRQFAEERIRKTSIEKKIEAFLQEINVDYKYSFFVKGRQFDFVVKTVNLLIEVQGDFWHANPKFWSDTEDGKKPLRDHQRMKKLDDLVKAKIAKDSGFNFVAVWEDDINNQWDDVVLLLKNLIEGEHP